MPQSLAKICVHITFSTKYRQPQIAETIESELFAYLGSVCQAMECHPIRVGGYLDHVHIVCLLSRKVALMDLIEEVKKSSSKWIKSKGEQFANFYWQRGYGAFSVKPSEIDVVVRYVDNQKEHHRKQDFQAEFRSLLKKYGIDFDERYVWD